MVHRFQVVTLAGCDVALGERLMTSIQTAHTNFFSLELSRIEKELNKKRVELIAAWSATPEDH